MRYILNQPCVYVKEIAAAKNIFNALRYTTLMVVTFIRTFIVYVVLVVVMRLMGKRQIGDNKCYNEFERLHFAYLALSHKPHNDDKD